MTDAPTQPRWIEYVALADVVTADRNPKGHDKEFLEASIRRFGFVEPVLHDGRTGKLIAGHGRLETLADAETAGLAIPEGLMVDDDGRWLLPVVHGWEGADDREAEAYLLVANRAPERGGWIAGDLAAMLKDMAREADDLLAVGWSPDEYRELMSTSGLLSEEEGAWLDDLVGDATGKAPEKGSVRQLSRGHDVVDLRLPMSPGDRDEAVALLRAAARRTGSATLAAALLAVLREASGQ